MGHLQAARHAGVRRARRCLRQPAQRQAALVDRVQYGAQDGHADRRSNLPEGGHQRRAGPAALRGQRPVGSAMPRPTPTAANQADTNPVPLPAWVSVPTASATAMIANPALISVLVPATGARAGPPSRPLRGDWSRWPTPRPRASPAISGSIRTPLASESSPRTSRKNWGIANVIPNSANWTIVDSAVPQVKPAERNSDRSTSGWPFGRR